MTFYLRYLLVVTFGGLIAVGCEPGPLEQPRSPLDWSHVDVPVVDSQHVEPTEPALVVEITPERVRLSDDRLCAKWREYARQRVASIERDHAWWERLVGIEAVEQVEQGLAEYCGRPSESRWVDVMALDGGRVRPEDLKHGPDTLHVEPLFDRLVEATAESKRIARHFDEPWENRIIAVIDRDVPYRTLVELLYTTGQAELGAFEFVVRDSEGRSGAYSYNKPRLPMCCTESPGTVECAIPEVVLTEQAGFVLMNPGLWKPGAPVSPGQVIKPKPGGQPEPRGWRHSVVTDGRCPTLERAEDGFGTERLAELLDAFDEADYCGGAHLRAGHDAWAALTFGDWLPVLVELDSREGLDWVLPNIVGTARAVGCEETFELQE